MNLLMVQLEPGPFDFGALDADGLGAEGSGRVISAATIGSQCILIFSYKYTAF